MAPQVRLDLDLAPQLVFQVALLQLRLEEHLERHHELALLLARQVHVAELAAAQRPADLEVVQRPPATEQSMTQSPACLALAKLENWTATLIVSLVSS